MGIQQVQFDFHIAHEDRPPELNTMDNNKDNRMEASPVDKTEAYNQVALQLRAIGDCIDARLGADSAKVCHPAGFPLISTTGAVLACGAAAVAIVGAFVLATRD